MKLQGLLLVALTLLFSNVYGESKQEIVGAWVGDVFIDNPEFKTGFPTLLSFHQGGTMSEVHLPFSPKGGSPFGAFNATPAFGAWKAQETDEYKAHFQFFLQGTKDNEQFPSQHIGTNNVEYDVKMSADGNTLEATWASQLRDPQGKVILSGTGTFKGTRVQVK